MLERVLCCLFFFLFFSFFWGGGGFLGVSGKGEMGECGGLVEWWSGVGLEVGWGGVGEEGEGREG